MAERRMFAKSIVQSTVFLTMPVTSRLLYFALGMGADDDGIVEAYPILRVSGVSWDDLRILEAKGFVKVLNNNLVTYITDWKRNNQIKADRYRESIYKPLLMEQCPEAASASQMDDLDFEQQSIGTHSEPQDRIDQNRIDIYASMRAHDAAMAAGKEPWLQFWSAYPRHKDKQRALKAWQKLNPDPKLFSAIMDALKQAKASPDWQRDDGRYIPYPATWINGRRWEDEISMSMEADNRDEEEIWW